MRTQKKTAGVSRREVYGILTAQYAGHGCYMQGVFWAFRWQFGFRRLVPAGAELSFGGAAAPIQPTYHTLIRIFGSNGTSHTGHTEFLQPILHRWKFLHRQQNRCDHSISVLVPETWLDRKDMKYFWGSGDLPPAGISWNKLRKNTTIQVFPTKRRLHQTCV